MARAVDVAATLRELLGHEPGQVKIHKLLYYCQAWHVTWSGEQLFPERIEAWEKGPVVADLWRQRSRLRPVSQVDDLLAPDSAALNEDERQTIRYVVARYGRRWGTQLIGDTHAEAPWREAWRQGRNTVITLESMREFFRRDSAADQAWFWDDDWQRGERQADEDIREGRTSGAMDEDDFISSL